MSCIPDMMSTSLVAAVAAVTPRKGKIIKNVDVFERGENLLQNGILRFVFRFSQSSEIAVLGGHVDKALYFHS